MQCPEHRGGQWDGTPEPEADQLKCVAPKRRNAPKTAHAPSFPAAGEETEVARPKHELRA